MYPGFVFEFTDNITRSKTMVCCAGDLLINPTSLIALTLPARRIVKPLSAFCLCVRSDARPGKALSCRCNTSMQDLSGQTSLQKSPINTDSNIH